MTTNKTIFVLSLFTFANYCSMEVTIFDVGQGNSVLIGCTDKSKKEPPLLCDCGSSAYDYRSINHKAEQIDVIIKKIVIYARKLDLSIFNILISHPDIDHYNWITNVIDGCKLNNIKVGKITLGGHEKYYKEKFNTFLNNLGTKIHFLTKDDDTKTIEHISTSNHPTYQILPALQQTSEKKSNDCSLVLLVIFGNLRCIVMADATSKTMNHIQRKYVDLLPETYLYIASHHGAAEDGCNEESLLKVLKPKTIVLSSGIHGHKHPRAEIIRRFENNLDEDLPDYHTVISGIGDEERPSGLTYHALMRKHGNAKGKGKGYGLSVTNKALYGTLAQGTMMFTWNVDATTIKPPVHTIKENFKTKQLCVMKSLIQPPVSLLSLCFFDMINLSDLDIDDTEPTDNSSLQELLNKLEESGESLKKFSLSGKKIKTEDSFKLIKKILKNKSIREFKMTDIPLTQKQDIIKIWDNRGLDI